VGALTRHVKGLLEPAFGRVLVRGEVTGYRGPNTRGHLYFSIKDAEALVDVKVWASTAPRLRFELRDGLEVTVDGRLEIYAPSGRYSLIAQRLEPSGHGAQALALAQLRERLEADGVIGPGRRPVRPLPVLPRRVGVVTSRTGAALRDFLEVATARHPGVSILLADARVQGEGSAQEVVRALERLQATDVDVIVVTRGGGSAEDLWTFNEEPVVRAIAACRVPVVSAIGHEVDVTLADFAADVRAATPSAAAERVVPAAAELLRALAHWRARVQKAAERRLLLDAGRVEVLRRRLVDPRRLLDGERLRLADASDALAQVLRGQLREGREGLARDAERLQRCHPGARLRADRAVLAELRGRLERAWARGALERAEGLRAAQARLVRRSPGPAVAEAGAGLSALRERLAGAGRAQWDGARHRLERSVQALHALSPLAVMARGYAVVFRVDGTVLRRAEAAQVGEALSLRLLPPGAGERATLADAGEVQVTVAAVRPAR
jgi:exodeoxyribonuclease VII large subunit